MVLVIEVVESAHVLGVGDQPVDGGEVFALGQLLVQTPEHLHDTQGGGGHGVREVTTRGRHAAHKSGHIHFILLRFVFVARKKKKKPK